MTFVIPPTFSMPAGNPQALAELGQALVSLGSSEVGDEQRDRSLAASEALNAADHDLRSFWIGQAADRYGRSVLAGRERIRNVYRNFAKGGQVALTLAEVLATAQSSMQYAHQTAQYRAQQASASPIPVDPISLWSDLWSLESNVRSTLSQAHSEAASAWNGLTRAAPNHVADTPKPAEAKRPWWKKALTPVHVVLDGAGLVPVIGEVADGANGLIYLAEGDKLNAGLSFGSMVPVAGWASTGTKYAIKVDGAIDAHRAAGHAAGDVAHSVDGVGGGGHFQPGWNRPDPTPPKVEDIPPVGGPRDDAAYGGRNPFPPGHPANPIGGVGTPGEAAGVLGRRPGGAAASANTAVAAPAARPNRLWNLRPRFPTIVFPQLGGPAVALA